MDIYTKEQLKNKIGKDGIISVLPQTSYCKMVDLILHTQDLLLTLIILNRLAHKEISILVNRVGNDVTYDLNQPTLNLINQTFRIEARDYQECCYLLTNRLRMFTHLPYFRIQNGYLLSAEFKPKKKSEVMILSPLYQPDRNKYSGWLSFELLLQPVQIDPEVIAYHQCYGSFNEDDQTFYFFPKWKYKLNRIFHQKLQFVLTKINIQAATLPNMNKNNRFRHYRLGEGRYPKDYYGNDGQMLNIFAALSIDRILDSDDLYQKYTTTL